MLKIVRKAKSKLTLVRNVGSLRFPTLTHKFLDAPSLATQFHENQYEFGNELLNRICTAFQLAEKSDQAEDIWTELTAENRDFINALQNDDVEYLRQAFSNLFHGNLLYGMGHTSIFLTKRSPYNTDYFSLRCRDAVLALAEALAVTNLTSNQQTSLDDYMQSTNCDLDDYIRDIEQELGHSISAPPVGSPPVAAVGTRRISPDSVRHAYIPYRIKQLRFQANNGILEIGGGFGNVARYAYCQGFRNYTIVDIPYVTAIQAAFLAATIGAENIRLYGEDHDAPVKIHPSTRKEELLKPIDLVLNMDSLPEINLQEARDYLSFTQSKAAHFLSINQEAKKTHKGRIEQHSVPEMVRAHGGFQRLHRHPYWMEQGYAEEFYRISP